MMLRNLTNYHLMNGVVTFATIRCQLKSFHLVLIFLSNERQDRALPNKHIFIQSERECVPVLLEMS